MLTDDEIRKIPYTAETTTVIGDLNSIIHYITSYRFLVDWHARMKEVQDSFERHAKEHPHVWDHIVIPLLKPLHPSSKTPRI